MSKSIRHPLRLFLRVAAILGVPAGILSLGDPRIAAWSMVYSVVLAWAGVGFALAVESRAALRLWFAAAVLGLIAMLIAGYAVQSLPGRSLHDPLFTRALWASQILVGVSLAALCLVALMGWCRWLLRLRPEFAANVK